MSLFDKKLEKVLKESFGEQSLGQLKAQREYHRKQSKICTGKREAYHHNAMNMLDYEIKAMEARHERMKELFKDLMS